MTTTCNDVVIAGRAWNQLNNVLQPNPVVLLTRIRNEQEEAFSRTAGLNRDRYQTLISLNSSNGSSSRVIDLSGLGGSPFFQPVQRLLAVTLASGPLAGTPLSQVDPLDVDAEYAPRYIARAQTLVEVGADWGPAGVVGAQVLYVFGARDIDPSLGDLTQLVTIPDQFSDLLSLPLAKFFAQSDPGRDPAELVQIDAVLGDWDKGTGRRGAYMDYINSYSGSQFFRFDQPAPSDVRGVK